MVEDRLHQTAQGGARLDTEFVHQAVARPFVHAERLRLPAAAVQGDHQQVVEPFPHGVIGGELHQLAGDLAVAPGAQIRVVHHLQRGQPVFLELGRLARADVAEHAALQSRAAPQRQRPAQQLTGLPRVGGQDPPGLVGQVLEARGVRFDGRELQGVAARGRHDPRMVCVLFVLFSVPALRSGQQPAQPGHMELQRVRRVGGRVLAPQLVDEPLYGDVVPGLHHQCPQQRTLLGTCGNDPQTGPFVLDFHETEQAELHLIPSHTLASAGVGRPRVGGSPKGSGGVHRARRGERSGRVPFDLPQQRPGIVLEVEVTAVEDAQAQKVLGVFLPAGHPRR